MAVSEVRRPPRPIHPLYAFLLSAMVPLYFGALLCDIAYSGDYQMQWSNFAAWLLAGAMVFTGFAALWALIALFRADGRRGWPLIAFLLLAATFVVGLIDCFIHARDAYGTMPDGLVFTLITFILAAAAAWTGLSSLSAASLGAANLRAGAAQ